MKLGEITGIDLRIAALIAACFLGSIHAQDPEIPTALDRRLDEGSAQAIEEVLEMQPQEAVSIFVIKITMYNRTHRRSEYPGFREKMVAALASIPGHAEFIGERIEGQSEIRGSSGVRAACFEILGQLATEEAVVVAVRFANDYRNVPKDLKMIDPLGSADDFSPNAEMAVEALGSMNLPDAPIKNKKPKYYSGQDIYVWRQWAEMKLNEKGELPKNGETPKTPPGKVNRMPESGVMVVDSGSSSSWLFVAGVLGFCVLAIAWIVLRWQTR